MPPPYLKKFNGQTKIELIHVNQARKKEAAKSHELAQSWTHCFLCHIQCIHW